MTPEAHRIAGLIEQGHVEAALTDLRERWPDHAAIALLTAGLHAEAAAVLRGCGLPEVRK